jgi:hypothetical protein
MTKNPNPGDVSYFDWEELVSTAVSTGSSILTQTQAQKTAQAQASAAQATAQATQASAAAQQQELLNKIALLNTPSATQANNSKTIMYAGIAAAFVVLVIVVIFMTKKS